MMLTRFQRPEVAYWSPFRHLSSLREEIDRLFESPLMELTRSSSQFFSGWMPAVDLCEDKDSFHVKAELPGMKKEEIGVSIHDGVLTISGERKLEQQPEKPEFYRSERVLGRFQRAVTLPAAVNANAIKASYQEGILHIVLPKSEEAKPKQIEIRTN
jgi:HSP20 family protein